MKYLLTNQAHRILLVSLFVLALIQTVSTRQTLYVMDVSMHGSTYPQYASNSEYDVTKNSYPKTGDIAPDGIKEMYKLGQDYRKDYIQGQKYTSSKYDQNAVFLESIKDQPGLMSAYAFMLGAYPDSVGYLNIHMNNAQEHQRLVRQTLGISDTATSATRSIAVSTDEGFLYWSNASKQCPALHKKTQNSLKSAGESARDDYKTNLFPHIASKFGKSSNRVTFETAHKYLDDYQVARRLGKQYPQFPNQDSINKLIEEYERDYFYQGLVGGSEISRVISSPLVNYALLNTYSKSQEARGTIKDSKVHSLKHSHFFANEIGFASFLKALGHAQSTAPKGGQNVRLELFETNNKHFVSVSLDGKPLNFADSNHGIFELDSFLKTIYPRMYFGDIDQVCSGREEISLNVFPKCQDYKDYLQKYSGAVPQAEYKKPKKCRLAEHHVTEVVKPKVTTHQKPVELINTGFVEIVQMAPPQRAKVDVRIVEVDRPVAVPVPVVEEKVVVHEVEKLIQERPTHIHHINLEEPAAAPVAFVQEESKGWPWWLWLIPLLCLIPCLALLCCRRKEAEPVVRPKQPIAPVVRKPIEKPKKEIMHVQTEERHSPERKYVIEKRVVDEAEDIEQEITRELRKSRAVRESRAVRDISRGRQTAIEVAAEGAMNRGTGGGRRKRIKTIKKFGEVIGREIQYLDENGDVIRSERVGLDEGEARSERYASAGRAGGRTEIISSSNAEFVGGAQADHVFRDTYEREGLGATAGFGTGRASRRGYSSGRYIDNGGYVSGSNAGLVEDAEYGRYSPGGTRMSRVSRANSGGRVHEERIVNGTRRTGSGNFRTGGFGGGTGNYREFREERVTKGGTTRHREFFEDDDNI